MKIIDNQTEKLGDDLKNILGSSTKIQIASSIFSMYGFEVLKDELSKIEKLQFIFADPTFVEVSSSEKERI